MTSQSTKRSRQIAWLLCATSIGLGCGEAAPENAAAMKWDPVADGTPLITARVRRLSLEEYRASVRSLLGEEVPAFNALAPDLRQNGFSVNVAQIVDSVLASQLAEAASAVAKAFAAAPHAELELCGENRECAVAWLHKLAERAYRRPLLAEEQLALAELFDVGASDASMRDAVELCVSAILQAPSFLYVTGLGASESATVELTPHEVAAQIAYAITGAPPDQELSEAALNNQLALADQREAQARRLISKSSTRYHFRRFFLEWLGIDRVSALVKDSEQYPEFSELRSLMLEETEGYVDEIMMHEGASLKSLLTAGFSVAPPKLATWYELQGEGGRRIALSGTGRIGILQQASFLAAHSHPLDSGPVLRGVAVIRRLLCRELEPPSEQIPPPVPDPELTTRERFAVHSSTPSCAGCHSYIDPIGFSFENFDAMGAQRTTENGRAIDTQGALNADDRDVPIADSVALALALAESDEAKSCYVRQSLRFITGQSDEALEDGFLSALQKLAPAKRESALEIVVAFVRSELFMKRGKL